MTETLQEEIAPAIREWIDRASYFDLLELWRFAPVGSPFFQGAAGLYYETTMKMKKELVGDAAHVRASKEIGWR